MATATIKVGLRFSRHDIPLLRRLVTRSQNRELGDRAVHTLFAGALEAAQTGEPFIIEGTSRMEVELVASGFARYGCRLPAIDPLG